MLFLRQPLVLMSGGAAEAEVSGLDFDGAIRFAA